VGTAFPLKARPNKEPEAFRVSTKIEKTPQRIHDGQPISAAIDADIAQNNDRN
jgi:hypothetical protein